jgi:pimeloyl-ACP methyl ester carboxylesterase
MDIVLVAGLWLDGSAWDLVVPGTPDATLQDQVEAVLAAVDACEAPVLVVGHSAACTLAWCAADGRPTRVARVAMIGGFGRPDGAPYAVTFPVVDGVIHFPGWEPFEGDLSDDVSAELKERLARDAVSVPGRAALGIVRLTDVRRHHVPVTVVCPEFTPAEARAWVDDGNAPELAQVEHLDFVDIEAGHWPMFTKPLELARILAGLTS